MCYYRSCQKIFQPFQRQVVQQAMKTQRETASLGETLPALKAGWKNPPTGRLMTAQTASAIDDSWWFLHVVGHKPANLGSLDFIWFGAGSALALGLSQWIRLLQSTIERLIQTMMRLQWPTFKPSEFMGPIENALFFDFTVDFFPWLITCQRNPQPDLYIVWMYFNVV